MLKRLAQIGASLIIFSFHTMSYASSAIEQSHIMLVNNTNESIIVTPKLETADSNFKKGSQWDGNATTLAPYERKQVLWFARNEGVKAGKEYDFQLTVNNANRGEPILLGFRVTGKPVFGSSISTDVTLPQKNRQTILSSDSFTKILTQFAGADAKFYAYTWPPLGQLFNDFQYVIDQTQPVTVTATKNSELSVLSYNTQLMPFYANGVDDLNDPETREKDIPAKISNYDVVMMQELFDHDLRNAMIADMTRYYPYHTKVVGDGTNLPLTGGVVIFSKWPIEKEDQITYSDATGADKLAAKGVGYAVINKQGKRYHLFATHTNAGTSADAARVRGKQLTQFDQFIHNKNIPANEPVILGGDFNVDEFSSEYQVLQTSLHVTALENKGYRYSNDGLTNMMNNDKDRLRLDYVFSHQQNAVPRTSYNQVFLPRDLDDAKKWPKVDLSDHYPVASYFDFSA